MTKHTTTDLSTLSIQALATRAAEAAESIYLHRAGRYTLSGMRSWGRRHYCLADRGNISFRPGTITVPLTIHTFPGFPPAVNDRCRVILYQDTLKLKDILWP